MRLSPIILLLSICLLAICPAEDCTNAVDDDGDGLIDLNDPDCNCSPETEALESELIFNGGFELLETDRPECQGCISLYDGDGCPQGWLQNSVNLHSPCFTEANPPINIGYVSTNSGNYQGVGGRARLAGSPWIQQEFLQTSLISPIVAGQTYLFSGKFELPAASQPGINLAPGHRLVIMGGNNSQPLNTQGNGEDCFEDRPGWQPLAYLDFPNNPNEIFTSYSVSFLAPGSFSELAIVSACCQPDTPPEESLNYYGVDDLSLRPATPSPLENQLIPNSPACESPLFFCVSEPAGQNIQWYREGVAILGATEPCLVLPAETPDGTTVQVWITGQDNCVILESIIDRDCNFGTEICGNGIDDDGDGLVDINDPDCSCPDSSLLLNVTENYCPTNINLTIQDTPGSQIQWYAAGSALEGETGHELILGPSSNLNVDYRAVLTDSSGICFTTPPFRPTPSEELQFIWTNKVARCYGDSNACLGAQPILQNTGDYNYNWQDATGNIISQTAYLENIPAGNYSLMVTTPDGCTGNYVFTVSQPEETIVIPFVDAMNCPSDDDFSVLRLVTNNFNSSLEHCYFDSQNNLADCSLENIFSLPPGNYAGTSTDTLGCETNWGPVEISAPNVPAVSISASRELISLGEELAIGVVA